MSFKMQDLQKSLSDSDSKLLAKPQCTQKRKKKSDFEKMKKRK